MAGGRPAKFTQELADLICERLANGESLRAICTDEALPSRVTVIMWKNTNEEFFNQYARARDDQAELYADDIIDISDTPVVAEKVTTKADGSEEIVTGDAVDRSRLRVDSRKWLLSKLRPGTYGDKLQHANAAGDGDQKVKHEFSWAEPPKDE